MNNTFVKTAKLEKIEKRAYTEFAMRGRSMNTKIMIDLESKWDAEVQNITGTQSGRIKMTINDTEYGSGVYSYNFGDVIA